MLLLALLFTTVTTLLWYYASIRCNKTIQLGKKIPGPDGALPIIGHCHLIPINGTEVINWFGDITAKFGNVVRIWVGETLFIVITDPEETEVILSSPIHIEKSPVYKFLHPWLGTGLLTSTGQKWRRHRKALTPAFHFKILEQCVDVFNSNATILIEELRCEISGPAFDVHSYISQYALDNICETAMGTKVNAQINSTSDYVQSVKSAAQEIYTRMVSPWLYPDFIFSWTSHGQLMRNAISVLQGFTEKIIHEKKQCVQSSFEKKPSLLSNNCQDVSNAKLSGEKRRAAFLELLIEMTMTSNGTSFTDKEIREEVDTFMFEGLETTVSAVCFALHLLGKHQDVQERAMHEQSDIFRGSDRLPSYQDLQQMKYLEQVIKETLRLYPSVPLISRQLNEDLVLKRGHIVPAGCVVAVCAYFQHRDPKYFPNPLNFNPDNFLLENIQGRHPYAYIPFSAGPRNCIGQKFAMLEVKCTLSKILRHYRVLHAENDSEVMLDPKLVLRSSNGYLVKLELRRHSDEAS